MKNQHLLLKNNIFVENQQQWCYVAYSNNYSTFGAKTALVIVLFQKYSTLKFSSFSKEIWSKIWKCGKWTKLEQKIMFFSCKKIEISSLQWACFYDFSIKWWNYRNISNNIEVHKTRNFKDHIGYNFCNYQRPFGFATKCPNLLFYSISPSKEHGFQNRRNSSKTYAWERWNRCKTSSTNAWWIFPM